ncbi:LysR substrate-binding domain-containing protein [Tolumonas osonensis]|uniref:DNA-binding transcriptional LysR family regulator n=1 Tax=Tolumonas osonensis TaxID=675874 RepID=A0A841GLD7_9GAMM|nr:DNA-binding transcriptional LysR family regulator [Tolumonas osonensis]
MLKENINDLLSFLVVAQERSFTKAAAKLGISQSALSHTIKALEERLNLRLLNRTTRSVALTEAGERLVQTLAPRLEEIEEELVVLNDEQNGPSGKIRISSPEYAAHYVLWPVLEKFLPQYPDIHVEVIIENSFTDIVSERYDAGIRLGEQIAKDMIAVKISPEMKMAVVASPEYFKQAAVPEIPEDLRQHKCINIKPSAARGAYAWEFKKDDREINVKVEGQLTFNTSLQSLRAALAGLGLAYLPDDLVQEYVERGELVRVLESWCPVFDGFHIYYPSRRQHKKAFALLIDALRYNR